MRSVAAVFELAWPRDVTGPIFAYASILLLIICFFVSVYSERFVAYGFTSAAQRDAVRRWSWTANRITYWGMAAVVIALTLTESMWVPLRPFLR